MKIRNRLSNFYTLVAGSLLMIISIVIFFASSSYRENAFYQRLSERVQVTEQLFLEKESLSAEVYQSIRDKFLHFLPEEIEYVGTVEQFEKVAQDSLVDVLPSDFVAEVQESGFAEFHKGTKQGAGRLYTHNNRRYAVVVIASDQYGLAYINRLRNLLVVGVGIALLLIWVTSRAVARQALKPIAKKVREAQMIGASNLHLRLEVHNSKDELGQLAIAFNDLLDRLEKAFNWQKNFVRNASHELRNPLAAILGHSELVLRKTRSKEDYVEALQNIHREASRLNHLVNNILQLMPVKDSDMLPSQERLRLDELLLEAQETLRLTRPNNQVRVDWDNMPEDPNSMEIEGNANLLQSALVNLLDNACKFSNNQPVEVAFQQVHNAIELSIRDHGIGIPPEEREKVFQPLHRAGNARGYKGSGLGLALAQRIVELHHGAIELDPRDEEGTRVNLKFPVAAQQLMEV
ncbi:MAG: ATP-binding protein [Salibacteraceae bacterium]